MNGCTQNLIDLAGSEKMSSGQGSEVAERNTEGSHINKRCACVLFRSRRSDTRIVSSHLGTSLANYRHQLAKRMYLGFTLSQSNLFVQILATYPLPRLKAYSPIANFAWRQCQSCGRLHRLSRSYASSRKRLYLEVCSKCQDGHHES